MTEHSFGPRRLAVTVVALAVVPGLTGEVEAQGGDVYQYFTDREISVTTGTGGNPVATTNETRRLALYSRLFDAMIASGHHSSLGQEPFITDGTGSGTVVIDVNPGPNWSFRERFAPHGPVLTPFGDLLVVLPLDYGKGMKPVAINPATGSFQTLMEGQPVTDTQGGALTGSGQLVFAGLAPDGRGIFRTNGTPEGTNRIKNVKVDDPTVLVPYLAWVFLSGLPKGTNLAADSSHENWELWRTDGTDGGTEMIKEIKPGPDGSDPFALTVVNGKLWFGADDGQTGFELWMSDGTTDGTVLVADILPGPLGSIPFGFTKVGDRVLFVPGHPLAGLELFVTDGTPAGTKLVADIFPGPFPSQPRNLTTVGEGDLVIFWADHPVFGLEPWITDGTAQGTRLLMDINPGLGGSNPGGGAPFVPVGTRQVVFTADDGVHGPEPWVADLRMGTARMLANVYPGSMGSSPQTYVLFRGTVLFDAENGTDGRQFWGWNPGATSQPAGPPCSDGYPMPSMEATDPLIGKTMRFWGENAPPGSLGAIVFGEPTLEKAPLGAPCFVAIDIAQPTLTLGLFQVTQGDWSATLDLPADPSLVGVFGIAQTAFLGPSTSWGYEFSNGALLKLGN